MLERRTLRSPFSDWGDDAFHGGLRRKNGKDIIKESKTGKCRGGKRLDTNIFRYVITIEACGSISAAAKRLFMSQPALTKHIGKLEKQLGVKLYDRSSSPLALTPAGRLFLEYAKEYAQEEREFLERLKKLEGDGLERVLVATTHRGGAYAGDRTAAFLARFPEISLEYLDVSAEECENALNTGKADLAVYTDPVLSDQIEYMPLEEDQLVLVVPRSSAVLEGKDLSGNTPESPVEVEPERFRNPDLTWVLSTQNHSLYFAECAFFKKYGIAPVRSFRVDYVDTRYSIACGGGGIVLVPTTTVVKGAGSKDCAFCTIRGGSLYRYVIIAKQKGKNLQRGAENFWRFMVEQRFQH